MNRIVNREVKPTTSDKRTPEERPAGAEPSDLLDVSVREMTRLTEPVELSTIQIKNNRAI